MHIGIDLDDTLIELSSDGYTWDFIPGAISYLKLLSDARHTIHIITARDMNGGNMKQLENVILALESEGVTVSDVTYTYGLSKGSFAKSLQCICLIDDQEGYLDDCIENGVIPILFTRVHLPDPPEWRIAKHWEEVYRHVLDIYSGVKSKMDLIIYHRISDGTTYYLVPRDKVDTIRTVLDKVSKQVYNTMVNPHNDDYWRDFDTVEDSLIEWNEYRVSSDDISVREIVSVYTVILIV